MSDNKKWFKVWTSILLDPKHSNLSLKEVGRWTRLGALMVSQGENGMLTLYPPANSFLVAMECTTFQSAIDALRMLPNVHIEECKSDNGKTIVIMRNWFKYQVDPTAYERVKRSRYKRRGEEKRSLTSTSPSSPAARTALADAAPPLAGNVKIKSYEEASENEICGPPPGWANELKRFKK